ncbi:MAG: ELM1/GtrOC1 family putative glycosyltransferase [Rickettsia endosymbiont of Pentastiridius leporinus]
MKIWVLSDDRVGNTNQAIALAEKLAGEYTLIKLEYNCLAKLPNFLLKYYPLHIKNEILLDIFKKPLPDIIITAGRRTAVLAFYLKKKFGADIRPLSKLAYGREFEGDTKRRTAAYKSVREDSSTGSTYKLPAEVEFQKRSIKLIQIMQPCLPYNVFDAIILPYHDRHYCEAPYVIPINGALNNITEKFAVTNFEFQKCYPNLDEFIAVIIGGNNKKFNFDENEARLFCSVLNKIYNNQKIPFFISFSRRTPSPVKSIIKNNMPHSTIIYDPTNDTRYTADTSKALYQISGEPAERVLIGEHERIPKFDVPNLAVSKIYNPYIGMLANAKYIVATADSISMCSEAASSGKPLYIFCPPNFKSLKHKIFIKQLVDQKIARMLDESVTKLEEYNYLPLNETDGVANNIKLLYNF